MATDNSFKHIVSGLNLVPNGTTLIASVGDIDYDTTSGNFNLYVSTGPTTISTTSSTQTLTNKTINVSNNNIIGTVGTAAQFDPSTGNLESSVTTSTELGYVHGVTSSIQTQLNSKQGNLTFADSLVNTAGTVTLVNDSASPGASQYYGTNASSVLGYFPISSPLTFSDSLSKSGNNVTLVNDSASPGASMYYGTNASSVLGYYAVGTPVTYADSIVNTSGTVTLKGDNASPGATQYYGTNGSSVLGYYNIPATGVTSVALAAPSIFTVSGSPVTSSGTLTLSYSGTALPIANGGTGQTTASTAFNALAPATSTGGLIYGSGTNTYSNLPIGTSGQILTVSGGLPTWLPAPGTVSAFFVSSQVTTASSNVTSSYPTFTTFSNSPAFTFTPTITGTYKVYSSCAIDNTGAGNNGVARIFNTSGGAILLNESQGSIEGVSSHVISSVYIESVYTLTAGISYQFDIQGSNNSGTGVALSGNFSAFYMFAELEVSAASSGVSAKYYASSSSSLTANTPINFDTQIFDTNSAVTTGAAWKFTAPTAGKYLVSTVLTFSSYSGTPDLSVYINGTNDTYMLSWTGSSQRLTGTTVVNLNSGDYIDIRPDSAITTSTGTSKPYQSTISIALLSGSSGSGGGTSYTFSDSLVNAAGTVTLVGDTASPGASQYYGTNGSSTLGYYALPTNPSAVLANYYTITNHSTTALNPINFDTSTIDTNSAVTTGSSWKFTAPLTGYYDVSASILATGTPSAIIYSIYKNGSIFNGNFATSNSASSLPATACYSISLNSGDYVDVRPNSTVTILGGTLSNISTASWISIKQIH